MSEAEYIQRLDEYLQEELKAQPDDSEEDRRILDGWRARWARDKVDLTGVVSFIAEYEHDEIDAMMILAKAAIDN